MVTSPMKRYLPVVLTALGVCCVALSGCDDDHYSTAVKYGVRTDPLMVAAQPGELGADVYDPDRPGLLPLRTPKDVLNPDNPMHPKGMELFNKNFLRDPTIIPEDIRQKLDAALIELFGTPLDPKVADAAGLDADARAKLKLDDATVKEGGRLYRLHCVHCHGVPGDGQGPTARWISPHPRDFRKGLFKFMSVDQTRGDTERPPRREDLFHTLHSGIEGTAMPAFRVQLTASQLNELVSYVIHLSIRGKTEFGFISNSLDYKYANGTTTVALKDEVQQTGISDDVKDYSRLTIKKWLLSQDPKEAIQVPEYNWKSNKKDAKQPEKGEWTVWKGQDDAGKMQIRGAIALALFNNEEPTGPKAKEARTILDLREDKPASANCKTCHADYGRQAMFKFDAWGTLVRPNNFTRGEFRGGRRPVDIYHRIHSGISGSGMTPFGNANTLSSNSIWDLVEFVRALSYPAMRNRLGVNLD
jgi:mono/diheme cytochrome c family protein